MDSSVFPISIADIQKDFEVLQNSLQSYGIEYNDLRSNLNPSTNLFAFLFNCDLIGDWYGPYLNELVYSGLDKKANSVFFVGDILTDRINNFVYWKIFNDYYSNPDIIYKNNIYVVCVANISAYAFDKIRGSLTNEDSFLFGLDISKPSIEKYALTIGLIQKFIKLGDKLIYSSPELDDKFGNYSGMLNDDSRKLCPIQEEYYSIFLTNPIVQFECDYNDLKYSIKSLYDIDINDYPCVNITCEKIKYINKHIGASFSSEQLVSSIKDSFLKNKIYHIAKSGYNEQNCMDLNLEIFIENKKYQAALKWHLESNIATIITITS